MEKKILKELRQIHNVMILLALKSGATATEVGKITGIGYSNVSALLVERTSKKKAKRNTKRRAKA